LKQLSEILICLGLTLIKEIEKKETKIYTASTPSMPYSHARVILKPTLFYGSESDLLVLNAIQLVRLFARLKGDSQPF